MCVAWLPVLVFWRPAPFTVTFDDAYYYFTIGRHLAEGQGSSFDGINLTNGYHPLWLAICTLPYLLGLAGLAAVRAVLVLQLGLWAATLSIVATIESNAIDRFPRLDDRSRRLATAAIVGLFVLVAANPFVVKTFVNGLESGIAALVAVALLALSTQRGGQLRGDSRRAGFLVGSLFALAFLARTDAVFFIGAALVWSAFDAGRDRLRDLLPAFAPAAAVATAYLALNQRVFGDPLQVSGVVKRLPLTAGRTAAMGLVGVLALAVILAARRDRTPSERFGRTGRFFACTAWFASGCVLLAGYYRLLSVETYLWYYAPLVLYGILLLLHFAADLMEAAAREAPAYRSPSRQVLRFAILLGLPLVAAFVLSARSFADPELRSLTEGDRVAGEWMRTHLPPGAVAASWDAGVVAYFAERPVVNLDGLVNSFEYERARRRGPDATRRFLARQRVTFIVNHGVLKHGTDPDIVRSLDALLGPGVGQRAVQVHRIEYVYAGRSAGRPRGRRRWATFVYALPAPL